MTPFHCVIPMVSFPHPHPTLDPLRLVHTHNNWSTHSWWLVYT